MPRLDIRGVIVPNDYEWYYDFLGEEHTSPRLVSDVISGANGELIDVYINSLGGEIASGSEIYTMLNQYRNIMIHITGQAHSAASVVAMAGPSEMSPTALMMVHCVSTALSGNHSDFEHAVEMLNAADEALSSAYTAKSGMSKAQALAMMNAETWLTAEKAVELGLVDKITDVQAAAMTASLGFELPTQEQLETAKKIKESAEFSDKLRLKLEFLELKGATR